MSQPADQRRNVLEQLGIQTTDPASAAATLLSRDDSSNSPRRVILSEIEVPFSTVLKLTIQFWIASLILQIPIALVIAMIVMSQTPQ